MIDLTTCFIISISEFNNLLTSLNIPLTIDNQFYFASYLLTNAFAYMVCIIFLIAVYKCINRLFRKNGSLIY